MLYWCCKDLKIGKEGVKMRVIENKRVKPQRRIGLGVLFGLTAPVVSGYWIYRYLVKRRQK